MLPLRKPLKWYKSRNSESHLKPQINPRHGSCRLLMREDRSSDSTVDIKSSSFKEADDPDCVFDPNDFEVGSTYSPGSTSNDISPQEFVQLMKVAVQPEGKNERPTSRAT